LTSTTPPFFGKKNDNVRNVKVNKNLNNNKKLNRNRKRAGISPIIATTIIIAITVVLGLALWAFANTGVGSATQTYSDKIIEYGDYTKDRFIIANMEFNNPSADQVAFWIFNSGENPTTINSVAFIDRITCGDWNPTGLTQVSPFDPLKPLTVNTKELKKFYFDVVDLNSTPNTLIDCAGETFELTVVTDTGATQTDIKSEPAP
jgi:hypothetical protein